MADVRIENRSGVWVVSRDGVPVANCRTECDAGIAASEAGSE